MPDAEKVYREKHRPLFHFTSRFGWLNDPNGLVYHDKEWHLFYQHNPFGVNWGNMHWGHAVSPDLVRWKELGIGLYPKKYGDMAFSGSAVVDKTNTSGWGTKDKPPLVLAYTSTARGECIAYSNDNGRTWTEFDKNPVLKHAGRDPKLVWYEKGKHWVMAVYDEFQGKQWIAFHTSPDLKSWTFASRIEGFFECPDLFEMVAGKEAKWVLYGADAKYLIGDFDGKAFKPDFKEKKQLWYGNFYAAQTFDNASRRVQIGWSNGVTFPNMPFNQQMSLPVELTLGRDHRIDRSEHLRLIGKPVGELGALRHEKPVFEASHINPPRIAEPTELVKNLDAFEMRLIIDCQQSSGFTLNVRGTKLIFDAKKHELTCKNVTAPFPNTSSQVNLSIWVDRGSIEIFESGGSVAMSLAAIPDEKNRTVELIPKDEAIKYSGTIYRMKSAWEK